MAEAIWRHLAGDRYDVASAGTEPKPVHPLTLAVLEEIGVATTGLRSKPITALALETQPPDWIVTVCDAAKDSCPTVSAAASHIHWPVADPAAVRGSDEEILAAFRQARDDIAERIRNFLRIHS